MIEVICPVCGGALSVKKEGVIINKSKTGVKNNAFLALCDKCYREYDVHIKVRNTGR